MRPCETALKTARRRLRRQTTRTLTTICAAFACAVALLCAAPAHDALADRVSGRAFVGGSWMVGSQSYFSVSIFGRSTVGWCMNHGAAEPLSGWYGFTADRTVSGAGGSTDLWLDGSFEPVSYDEAANISRTGQTTFRAGTPNAHWDVFVPAGCTAVVDGTRYPAGSNVRILPGQSVFLESDDPASLGGPSGIVSLDGTAHADAGTVEVYRNIVITPPGAWDGESYFNGLPAGYQRVGIGPVTIERPASADRRLQASARFAATVRYYVDDEQNPCFTERVPAQSAFRPAPEANETAAKPDCSPGLDAWYRDRNCTFHATAFAITQDVDVHGRNLATLTYAPSPASGLQFETDARDGPDPCAREVPLSSLLPSPRIVPWGTAAALQRIDRDVLHVHDGTRWRTLRRPDEGWHLAETAMDPAVTSVRIERNLTVYDYWTKSTYDGVLDW